MEKMQPLTVGELITLLETMPKKAIVLDENDIDWGISDIEYDETKDECVVYFETVKN